MCVRVCVRERERERERVFYIYQKVQRLYQHLAFFHLLSMLTHTHELIT